MAKKSKDPNKASSSKPEKKPEKPNTNIFSNLFGEIPDEETPNSLFSDDNPFRRKPTNSTQKPPIQENPKIDNIEENGFNSKKRNKDEIPSLEGKKSKKEKKLGGKENPNLGKVDELGLNVKLGEKENPNLGNVKELGLNVELDEKKEKKRKRDELEREYEVKKYGVAPNDEEEEKKGKNVNKKKRKSIENPAEMMVSQEGYDDESKLLRTVFVGNLPLKIKKKVLIKEFSKFGEIDSVRIRSVPTLDSKKPKKVQIIHGKLNDAADSVNAYVVFKTEQAAEASLAHNMSVVGEKHIRVDRACPPRKKLKGDDASATLYSNKRTVFVGNLPFDVKDEELYQLFCGIKQLESSIEAVRVIRDRETSLGKGIAYVLFKTREAANLLCKKHNLKLRDRELRISHAKPSTPSTPAKRKSPVSGDSESSPAKKISVSSKSPRSRYKVTPGGDTSYQGLRASKSGEKTKTPIRAAAPAAVKLGMKSGDKIKQRSEKRPSVAARKAKANNMKDGGIPKQTGNKRKMDARTPQSSNNKKKFKKFSK